MRLPGEPAAAASSAVCVCVCVEGGRVWVSVGVSV